jgi:hypothetical protein
VCSESQKLRLQHLTPAKKAKRQNHPRQCGSEM